jgi:hypothetical protein
MGTGFRDRMDRVRKASRKRPFSRLLQSCVESGRKHRCAPHRSLCTTRCSLWSLRPSSRSTAPWRWFLIRTGSGGSRPSKSCERTRRSLITICSRACATICSSASDGRSRARASFRRVAQSTANARERAPVAGTDEEVRGRCRFRRRPIDAFVKIKAVRPRLPVDERQTRKEFP